MRLFGLVFVFVMMFCISCQVFQSGGYTQVNPVPSDAKFTKVSNYAKEQYRELTGASIVSVATQVVSGINYKIVYQTASKNKIEVVVNNVPWDNTYKIVSFKRL